MRVHDNPYNNNYHRHIYIYIYVHNRRCRREMYTRIKVSCVSRVCGVEATAPGNRVLLLRVIIIHVGGALDTSTWVHPLRTRDGIKKKYI